MKKFLFSVLGIAVLGAIAYFLPNMIELVRNVEEINITFNLIKIF